MFTFLTILWFAALIFVVAYLVALAQIIPRMRALQIEIRAGSTDEIKGLDIATLEQTTRELEALGFERMDDLIMRNSLNPTETVAPIADPSTEPALQPMRLQPQILSRVLRHSQNGCLGIISSLATIDTKGKRSPKTTSWISFNSFSQSAPEKWSYSTSSYQPPVSTAKMMQICRLPFALWTRIPQATGEQLLNKHLARRQQVARAARIEWKSAPTIADYIQGEQEWVANARAVFAALTPLRLWNRLRTVERDRKNPEWLGELKGQMES